MATYLKGHWPTAVADRPSPQAILRTLYQQGFTEPDALAVAYAIVRAESGRDPKAYLSYVDIGEEKDYRAWKKAHPGQKALDAVRADMKKIPTNLAPREFQARLRQLRRKYLVASPLFTVLSSDRGLFQISSKYHPDLTGREAFTLTRNAAKAFEIYHDWGNSFKAWATFNNKNYEKTLPDARKEVKRFMAAQLKRAA